MGIDSTGTSGISLSVCMIVRDEEPVLERCLKNVILFADELIVVDTGSTDRTKEIAKKYTDKFYEYSWKDDFAAARNFSYEKAACDYIMWMDADDDLEPDGVEKLRELKEQLPEGTDVVFLRYTGDSDRAEPLNNSWLMRDRIIRRALNGKWYYPIHEGIPIDKNWQIVYRPDIEIFHRKAVVNEEKRNLRIFEKKMAEGFQLNHFNRSYYCRELANDGQYEKAVAEFEQLWDRADVEDIHYALFFYIQSMQKLRSYDVLEERLRAYLQRFAEDEMVLCNIGECCYRKKSYEEAIHWYERAQNHSIDPCDGRLHCQAYHTFYPLLGQEKSWYRLGDMEKAVLYFNKAAAIYPDSMEIRLGRLGKIGKMASSSKS